MFELVDFVEVSSFKIRLSILHMNTFSLPNLIVLSWIPFLIDQNFLFSFIWFMNVFKLFLRFDHHLVAISQTFLLHNNQLIILCSLNHLISNVLWGRNLEWFSLWVIFCPQIPLILLFLFSEYYLLSYI